MKKTLFILLLPFIFLGCEKNEENELDSRLVGTKWQTYDHTYEIIYGGKPYEVYEFISTTEVEKYTTNNNIIVDFDGNYKYTLDYPNLSIIINDSTKYDYVFISSREFIRKGTDGSGMYQKYIKQ